MVRNKDGTQCSTLICFRSSHSTNRAVSRRLEVASGTQTVPPEQSGRKTSRKYASKEGVVNWLTRGPSATPSVFNSHRMKWPLLFRRPAIALGRSVDPDVK